ncbi:hypothetical protein [Zunongwangia endophytica]|uniref:Uncharacterized protein n=1 Tax=Zunongwangia endophytica TaxID=1808945 RepID=A0ABV8HF34_9FLAO|nr:hypothetical protein [Zunongwangia endophytica]MDN3596912.1 hypothetical protein [Zunongwangia endophytica]
MKQRTSVVMSFLLIQFFKFYLYYAKNEKLGCLNLSEVIILILKEVKYKFIKLQSKLSLEKIKKIRSLKITFDDPEEEDLNWEKAI